MATGILTTIQCIPLDFPEAPPEISAPFVGVFKMMRESLYKVPDPSDMVAKLMNFLQLALAPVRPWLEMLEGILAIKDCIEAVPKIITDPTALVDCMKKLVKVITRMLAYQPPMSYVKALVDICGVLIMLMDELIRLIVTINDRLVDLTINLARARALGDMKLVQIIECGSTDLKAQTLTLFEFMKFVTNPLSLFVEPVLRLIPNDDAQKAADAIQSMANVDELVTELEAMGSAEIATGLNAILGAAVMPLGLGRKSLCLIHNIFCVTVGKNPIADVDLPTLQSV